MKKLVLLAFIGLLSASFTTAVFGQNAGLANPIITEIMYNPPETNNDTLEFLEIYNPNLSNAYNLEGAYFSSGIEYTFPAGYSLPADSYVILSGDSVIFEEVYGLEAFEWTGGTALSNDGEGITLRTDNGLFVLDSVYFDDTNAWPDADGTGYSLVLCDPTSDNNLPESWTLSENATGIIVNSLELFADPGVATTCTPTGVADAELTELNVFPNPSNGEFRLQMEAVSETTNLRIFNTMGQVVFSEAIAAGTNNIDLTTGLKAGHYILTLEKGQELQRMKLIVQ